MLDKVLTLLDRFVRMLQVKVFPVLVKFFFRVLLWTNRIELVGVDKYYQHVKSHPSIVVLWHNRVVLTPNFFGEYMDQSCNYTAYVSGSRDGEWLALATESYPHGFTIRVPKRNKHESLRAFIKTLKKSVLVVTPDGPRGPKYEMKPGVVFAASAAKAQLFPFSWRATKTWKLKSWDGLRIPKPFGKMIIGFGDPFFVHTDKKEAVDNKIKRAENALNQFEQELEARISALAEPVRSV